VTADVWDKLRIKYPVPNFPESDGRVKLSLAWILDKVCGLKGVKKNKVGTYVNQALVIYTENGATATEVLHFAEGMAKVVKEKVGLDIEREVEWVH